MKLQKNTSVFIIAEVSANHRQDLKAAIALIKSAKACGADAVKFQAYTPDTMTLNMSNKYFNIHHPKWGGQTLYELYKKAYTPWVWFKKLKKVADDIGILFFATAFDKTSVDMLEEIDVPIHKIASFELNDLPLIEYIAKTKKPLILSTGMATISEIREAALTAKKYRAKEITLLKCVSSYPAEPESMNLNTILDMKKVFNCSIGLSDHTLGNSVSLAAVALGARIIEKHFTLSRKMKSPDSFFSIEPIELKRLVDDMRIVEKALGDVRYGSVKSERASRVFRRSIFAIEDIKKGEIFTHENIRSIRPGHGLAPKFLRTLLGKKSKISIKRGIPIKKSAIKD